jgi:RNA polymerase sigma factor (sigma-70 family)
MSDHEADYDLIDRYARTGGADDLTQLVGRYLNLVHSAARRQLGGDAHRAADVTQQVFIVLMRKAKTIRPGTVVASWLLNVTRYECRNVMRAEGRRNRREREVAAMTPEARTGSATTAAATMTEDAAMTWAEIAPHLDAAMEQLNPGDRDAVVLKYFQGRSSAEAAAALGTSEGSVRQRVYRGLTRIRQILSKRGVVVGELTLGAVLTAHAVEAAPAALTAAGVSAGASSAAAAGSAKAAISAKGMVALMSAQTKTVALIVGLVLAAVGVVAIAMMGKSNAVTAGAPAAGAARPQIDPPSPAPPAPRPAGSPAIVAAPAPKRPAAPPPVVRGPRKLFDVITARSCDEKAGPKDGYDFLGYINQGDWAKYSAVDLGPAEGGGSVSFLAVVSCPPEYAGHEFEVHVDTLTGPIIARLTVESTGGHGTFLPEVAPVDPGFTGTHDIFLRFNTGGGFNLKSIKFVMDGRPATDRLPGTSYAQAERVNESQSVLVQVRDGAWARYDGLDFGKAGLDSIQVCYGVTATAAGGVVSVRLDRPNAPPVGEVRLKSTGGHWIQVPRTTKLTTRVTGRHDVYLTFAGQTKEYQGILHMPWFRFKNWEPADAIEPSTRPATTTRPTTLRFETGARQGATPLPAGPTTRTGWLGGLFSTDPAPTTAPATRDRAR